MNITKHIINTLLVIALVLLSCCTPKSNQTKSISEEEKSIPKGSYERNVKGIVEIETYDHYNRKLNTGYGFYIAPKLLVTNLNFIKGSYKAKVAAVGTDDYYDVAGYTAYDLNNNLVILKTWRDNINYLHLNKAIKNIPDSATSVYRKSRKMFLFKAAVKKNNADSAVIYQLDKNIPQGLPAFTILHHLVGFVQQTESNTNIIIPASYIQNLSKKQLKEQKPIIELAAKTNKIYPSYKTIKGFKINTTMGNFSVKLYNETPKFRDNFIKLVSDNFYDSLLVHRVLKNFLIQTGAADSKYADKDDLVGWQGPGYNLETQIVNGLYHKRGAIAASKMPPERNPKDRSDGSQFYIVAGRKYSMLELQEIEREKNIKFTQAQIDTYTTIGGAPHLDGDYTVFGEITSGMDVVDKIAAVETYDVDRPVNNIRVLSIDIIKR